MTNKAEKKEKMEHLKNALSKDDQNTIAPRLMASLQGEALGFCIKDHNRVVSYQNETCIKACGDQSKTACEKGCMEAVSKSIGAFDIPVGLHYFSGTPVDDGSLVDTVVIKDEKHLTTLFYPRKENVKAQFEALCKYDLSDREKEILLLVLQRVSRKDISKQLCISLSTLKTHINNIYKKLPVEWANQLKERRVD